MSTAKFDTLSNVAGTQSVPVATVAQGSAKAWVNFNGQGTVAIRSAFNVSSITDVATGNYQVNFTNAMPDANFAANASTQRAVSWADGGISVQSYTVNSVLVANIENNTNADTPNVSVAIFR